MDAVNDNMNEKPAVGAKVQRDSKHDRPKVTVTQRASRGPLEVAIDMLGHRPGGQTPSEAPLVRAAVAATRHLPRPVLLYSDG